ncbi:hypothetical protein [Luteolibacter soli]|uniref:Uncharacterized protein n=1 Tax=Luteolibacter soli TaxID=3135280 RepID=A0ABU9AP16_9BACT
MIFWSGKGILTLIILLLSMGVSQGVYEFASGLKPPEQDRDMMFACSFLLGAVGNFLFARYLDKKPKRMVIDKQTGEEFALDQDGSLFFIRVRKWTWIFAVASGICWMRFLLGWD